MGKILNVIAALFILAAAAQGCSTSGCTDNQNALPLAGLYSASTMRQISIDSIDVGGIGAPDDSLLYSAGTAVDCIYLPFRSTATECSFFIHYAQKAIADSTLNDTISFTYSSEPRFVSEDCGAMYFYTIQSMTYTRHIIDSIAITDSLVTNADLERLKIYFRTAENPGEPVEPTPVSLR